MERATPRVNPKVNYERWVMMMCQCGVIKCNKRTTLGEDVNNWGAASTWEISVTSPQFCYEF